MPYSGRSGWPDSHQFSFCDAIITGHKFYITVICNTTVPCLAQKSPTELNLHPTLCNSWSNQVIFTFFIFNLFQFIIPNQLKWQNTSIFATTSAGNAMKFFTLKITYCNQISPVASVIYYHNLITRHTEIADFAAAPGAILMNWTNHFTRLSWHLYGELVLNPSHQTATAYMSCSVSFDSHNCWLFKRKRWDGPKLSIARATSCSWLPGQQDCLRASTPTYPQWPALCQWQPVS